MISSDEMLEEESLLNIDIANINKDIIKYAPSKILGTIMNLILVPIYTNLLTPDEYGLYNVSISVLSLICIIFSDWIGISALRFFKEHYNSNNISSYFSTLLFLPVSNLTLMYVCGFSFFGFIRDFFRIPSELLYIVILLIIPVALRALLFQILRAQIKPLAYTFSVIINQLTTAAIAVYFIKNLHTGAKSILLGMAISIVAIDIVMLVITRISKSLKPENIEFFILKDFYKYGLPIALSSIGLWIISQSNRFVLQHFKGSYYNGLLGVGFNLTFSTILPLFAIITLAAIPRIFNKYEAGENVNHMITKLTGYYYVIFSPIIFILCAYPREIVAIFSNNEYAESSILIPFLAISIFIFGLTEYTTIQYHLAKKTYIDTIIKIVPGVLGLLFSMYLIPRYGIWGVGVSTLTSYAFYFILSILIRIKDLSWIPPYKVIYKSSTALFVCFISCLILKNIFNNQEFITIIVQIFVISLIYVMTLKLQYLNK